ncbi:MAG: phage GP46 family protein [Baekduiaceae bacterium]
MPGLDRKIDPITHDYVSDGAGGYEKTSTAQTALQHQLQDELGNWVGDPDAGSNLFKFARGGNSERRAAGLRDGVRAAVKPLVDAGMVADVQVGTTRDQTGRLALQSSLRDVQSGAQVSLVPMLSVGP